MESFEERHLSRSFRRSTWDHLFRARVPSISRLTYSRLFQTILNPLSSVGALLFPEFRQLPPAHLRARVGAGNSLLFNHANFMVSAYWFWLDNFSRKLCDLQSSIMEIGCGCGKTFQHIHDIGEFTGSFVGIDIDSEMLTYCRKHFNRPSFSFIQSNHQNSAYSERQTVGPSTPWHIPLSDECLDFVYSSSLFSHLFELEIMNYLCQSYRLLKPGGAVRMSFFCIESVEKGNRWNFKHRKGNAYIESLKVPEAAVAFEKSIMESFFCKSGFTQIEFRLGTAQSEVIARKPIGLSGT